jgi:hypothetical protein
MTAMAQQFEVEAASGRCATTGRTLEEGEEFYTVLLESGDSFRRADYSLEAWTGPPEGAYCHFRSRVPVKEKRKKMLVNNELLAGFFERLADEAEPVRVQFRFVLALILMRKRLLRYEDSGVEEGTEVWRMTLVHDRSEHRVVNPRLTDEQIEGVSRQLTAILHSDMGEWATVGDGEAGPELPGHEPQQT